nr:hypothetical protein [uncultured Desulfobulbus sp.]
MNELQEILEHLLQDNALKLPFSADESTSYREKLNEYIDLYKKRITELKSNDPLPLWLKSKVKDINKIRQILLKSVDLYLSGSAGKAYDQIEKLMKLDVLKENLPILTRNLFIYNNGNNSRKSLYRVRKSETHLNSRDEIFHVPFNKRHLIKPQRYSIAGLPCLYLGSSLYVCWQEMGKPNLSELFISRFNSNEYSKEFNVIDFAFSLESLQLINLDFFIDPSRALLEYSKAYLIFWPIVLSCSFSAQYPGSNFIVEYIIPNLITQWIGSTSDKLCGITYLSTKTEQLKNNDIGINFVFPPKIRKGIKSKFCSELNQMFEWSNPVSWQLLDAVNHISADLREGERYVKVLQKTDNLESEIIRKYSSTKFHQMEFKLRELTKVNHLE